MDFFRTKRDRLSESSDVTQTPLSLERITALTLTGSEPHDRPLIDPGTELYSGRFIIRELIGTGGEGVIYRAEDTARKQDVALKLLRVEDASSIPVLKREFRFLQDLLHPSLVSLHELIVDRELSYFTMSLVEGVNFLEAASDTSKLRHLLGQLAEVLTFLHSTGRVHRDIKPTNILVKPNGNLVLMDFGIGVNLHAPSENHRGAAGTPRYIAPELLRDEEASPLCDAYSVGVLLFEALTGKHPSPTERTEASTGVTCRPSTLKSGIPADLDRLCADLLEPDPTRRLSLEAVLNLSPETSRRFDSTPTSSTRRSGGCFVGRTHELGRLEESFLRMQEGYLPVAVFVEARSGMGKTAFLDEFLSSKTESVVLRSRCFEHELVPHKAIDGIVDKLVRYLETRDEVALSNLIPESERSILVQLFPEFERLAGLAPSATRAAAFGDYLALRQRAYLALAGVLGKLSDEVDLIVAIDDLQWGDIDSGRLLRQVFAGPDRPHCLLVLAYRPEEKRRSACLREVLEGEFSLRTELLGTTISLEPLLKRDARTLIERLSPQREVGQDLFQQILAEAKGSPLLLTEMALHLEKVHESEESIGISDILKDRVDSLSLPVQEAFGLLCCSGSALPTHIIQLLCEQPFEDVTHTLIQARLGRTRRGGQEIEVIHDSLREAMLESLGERQRYFHLRLAEGLVRSNGDAAEIARHFDAAGDPLAASEWAEEAALRASHSFALNHAVELFQVALSGQHSEAHGLRLKGHLADALADSGRGAEAAPLFAEVAAAKEGEDSLTLRGRAAEHWLISGNASRGHEVLHQVQQGVGMSWPKTSHQALRLFLWERFQLGLALKRFRPNHVPPPTKELNAQLQASRSAWPIAFVSTPHGAANSARYLRLALKGSDRKHQALGFCMEAIFRASAGSSEAEVVKSHRAQAAALMPDPSAPYQAAYLLHTKAQCSFLIGQPRSCLEDHDAAQKLFSKCRNVSWELNSGRIFYSQALSLLGRLNVWEKKLALWLKDAEQRGDACLYSGMKIGQARHHMATQLDSEEARELLRQAVTRWDPPFGGVHYFMEKFAQVYISTLEGKPHDVLSHLSVIEREMRKTHMLRVQVPRLHLRFHRAYAQLEIASELRDGSSRRSMLRTVEKAAESLRRENVSWATGIAMQLEAHVRLLTAPTRGDVETLLDAARLFEQEGFFLFAGASRIRAGLILDGEEGRAIHTRGTTAFSDVGVTDPLRCMRAYIPVLSGNYF